MLLINNNDSVATIYVSLSRQDDSAQVSLYMDFSNYIDVIITIVSEILMFHEYDVVKLKHALSSDGPQAWPTSMIARLDAGAIGTVVMVYTNDSVIYEYEVEFLDADGKTLVLLMLKQDELELV